MKRRAMQSADQQPITSKAPEKPAAEVTEKQVTESSGDEGNPPELVSPRHRELLRRTIRLSNGTEMEMRQALANLDILRLMQENNSDEFLAIVSLGRPKGATSPPTVIPTAVTDALGKRGHIRSDGTLRPELAAVLDAAYKETPEGTVLVDPIVYASRDLAKELEVHEDKSLTQLARLVRGSKKARGEDDTKGPSP